MGIDNKQTKSNYISRERRCYH